ncbi:MAG: NAD-dependent epimerase/dehydratase family protein [Acidobacteria bacterium]|nr:NAD-dependent epimerase/dehydratase family protein [Acidobacteriota bacterium]
MRILVTGGAGFIGGHLVERLARERAGAIVVADNLRRGDTSRLHRLGRDVTFAAADVRDRAALIQVMRGCDLVFHLAAQSNVMGAVKDPAYSFMANVGGTFNVLFAARAAGVKRVVFTSSREIYGDPECLPVTEEAPVRPKNAYGASKAAGEIYCRAFGGNGTETVILRLTNVYGTGDRDRVIPVFVERALRGDPLVLYGGHQVLDFVWIDIVVEALWKAACGRLIPGPVNVGSGKGVTIAELASRILHLTGSRSPLRVEPGRDPEVGRFIADTARARELLGIPAPHDPLDRLADVVDWTRQRLRMA